MPTDTHLELLALAQRQLASARLAAARSFVAARPPGPVKLNLASGTDIKDPPWVNLDVVPKWELARRGCDIVWDARTDPLPFADNTVEEIYAGYLLLHLAPCYHAAVLEEIRRVLTTQGVAIFGEVDMDIVLRRFLQDPLDKNLRELIWGEQGSTHGDALADFDKHCNGFTPWSLEQTLRLAGFTSFAPMKVHTAAVYYELTIGCMKMRCEGRIGYLQAMAKGRILNLEHSDPAEFGPRALHMSLADCSHALVGTPAFAADAFDTVILGEDAIPEPWAGATGLVVVSGRIGKRLVLTLRADKWTEAAVDELIRASGKVVFDRRVEADNFIEYHYLTLDPKE